MQRAVGYFRVSDQSQVDSYSLDSQEHRYQRWIETSGNVDVGRYRDVGQSAFHESGNCIHSVFDEYFSRMVSDNTKKGLQEKAE